MVTIHHFEKEIPGDLYQKYQQIVAEIIMSFEEYPDFEDFGFRRLEEIEAVFDNIKKCFDDLHDLISKAETLADNDDTIQAWAITRCITEQILQDECSTSSEYYGFDDLMEALVNTVQHIHFIADTSLQDEIFDTFNRLYHEEHLFNESNGNYILDIMDKTVTDQTKDTQFLALIDDLIQKNMHAKKLLIVEKLLKRKYYYFKNREQFDEADDIIKSNPNLNTFRHLLVEKLIAEGILSEAKAICCEAMMHSSNMGYSHIGTTYLGHLQNIAKIENNLEDQQKYAEEEYKSHNCRKESYVKLKALFPPEPWKDKVEELINYHLETLKRNFLHVRYLADIYAAEGFIDRLLKIILNGTLPLNDIDPYARFVWKQYPTEMLSYYESNIHRLAEFTTNYEKIAKYLRRMLKIQGGLEPTKALIHHLLITYKNRHALKRTLKDAFSDLAVL